MYVVPDKHIRYDLSREDALEVSIGYGPSKFDGDIKLT